MTSTVFMNGRSQAVRIPKELRFEGTHVTVERHGDGLLLRPVKPEAWPEGFFDAIKIDDESFERPAQDKTPPIVDFDA